MVDNGSTDGTFEVAKQYTPYVIKQNNMGYGNACLAGIKLVNSLTSEGFICFFDGDGQSLVEDIKPICKPVIQRKVDFCQGSRMIHGRATLHSHAFLANKLFTWFISTLWKSKITDLGPLRCIELNTLNMLGMSSKTFSWTIEMNAKLSKLRIYQFEVNVGYKKRKIGKSKISGNLIGSLKAVTLMSTKLLTIGLFF